MLLSYRGHYTAGKVYIYVITYRGFYIIYNTEFNIPAIYHIHSPVSITRLL